MFNLKHQQNSVNLVSEFGNFEVDNVICFDVTPLDCFDYSLYIERRHPLQDPQTG